MQIGYRQSALNCWWDSKWIYQSGRSQTDKMQQKLKHKAKTSIYKERYKQRKNIYMYIDKQKYGQTNKIMDNQIEI